MYGFQRNQEVLIKKLYVSGKITVIDLMLSHSFMHDPNRANHADKDKMYLYKCHGWLYNFLGSDWVNSMVVGIWGSFIGVAGNIYWGLIDWMISTAQELGL